jgi:hypothetical protein
MNKETRIFIYGFFLLGLGLIMFDSNGHWLTIIASVILIIAGASKIDRVID